MKEWFECKVSYEKETEDGKMVKVKEDYLVDAMSFIEAETRLTEKVSEIIVGDFSVEALKREKVFEIIKSDSGDWFKNKVEFISVNENGKEKKTKAIIYLQTTDIKKVASELSNKLSDSMMDYSILSINKTSILEVFEYNN
jgi:hypothetical protein